MLETLEARLAAQSEALFPELRPALPTGPRSHPPLMRSTKPNPSTTLNRTTKKSIPQTSQTAITADTSANKPVREIGRPEGIYAPKRRLPQTKDGIPIPDADVPHTQLGEKISKRTKQKYAQAREFGDNGDPIRDIHFSDHGFPNEHPNPHQHLLKENLTGGTQKRDIAKPLKEWNYE